MPYAGYILHAIRVNDYEILCSRLHRMLIYDGTVVWVYLGMLKHVTELVNFHSKDTDIRERHMSSVA